MCVVPPPKPQEYIHKYVFKTRMKIEHFQNIENFEAVTFGLGNSQWSRMDNYKSSLPGIQLRQEKVCLFPLHN